jgi:heat-inducible transcriptional repressor
MASAFEAVDTVREVLSILEQQFVVVTVLRDVLDRGLQVAIGSETGLLPLAECALIVSPYEVEGEHAGTIGVLGPSRMNYPQALAAVAVVSRRLGRHLTEG